MNVQLDSDVPEQALRLRVDGARSTTSIRCTGTLDAGTCEQLLDALADVLGTGARRVKLDVTDLTVTDLKGASALVRAQRAVRDVGGLVVWRGLDRAHLGGLAPIRHVARRRPRPVGSLQPSRTG